MTRHRYAVERGVARHVEQLGVGEVVDRDARHLAAAAHPDAVARVAVAVGERDHAGHQVVGGRDLDLDRADA